jgi:hypothetical protein
MSDLILYTDAKAELKGGKLIELAKQFNLTTFVETGTYSGEMIKYVDARHKWDHIYSIELSQQLYERAVKLFNDSKHIKILCGDSGEVLKTIPLRAPALFWLDAHYSCGCTARGKKITPLMEELNVILSPVDHVIVIDDLDNLPKWGVAIDMLKGYIKSLKPQVEFEVVDTMLIVKPDFYGGL